MKELIYLVCEKLRKYLGKGNAKIIADKREEGGCLGSYAILCSVEQRSHGKDRH